MGSEGNLRKSLISKKNNLSLLNIEKTQISIEISQILQSPIFSICVVGISNEHFCKLQIF